MIDYATIRPDIKQALDDWATKGWQPGGFLTAVLHNYLSEALARADDDNIRAIHSIVGYVYNECPSPCWGSPEKVAAWAKRFESAPTTERESLEKP
jgi:hypothetical protein